MAIVPVLKAYERHISAAAMAGGFAIDNFAFGRLDHPATQAVMIAYLVAAASSILLLHYQGERADNTRQTFRWGGIVSGITQFAFGGLWSAFLIFYSRSSVIATAWPFLLILVFIFLGNEIFSRIPLQAGLHSNSSVVRVIFLLHIRGADLHRND
jgi:hypothetical protein